MSTAHGGAGGAIVNVSSAAARLGSPGLYVDYAASKGAIDTLTIGLAREVADEGVRVNAVRPGIIDTEIHASAGMAGRAREAAPLPMQRAGTPDEVGRGDRLAAVGRGELCDRHAARRDGRALRRSGAETLGRSGARALGRSGAPTAPAALSEPRRSA